MSDVGDLLALSLLMHTYEQLFFGKEVVAQLLLSSDDFTSRVRYRNLQNTLAKPLKLPQPRKATGFC